MLNNKFLFVFEFPTKIKWMPKTFNERLKKRKKRISEWKRRIPSVKEKKKEWDRKKLNRAQTHILSNKLASFIQWRTYLLFLAWIPFNFTFSFILFEYEFGWSWFYPYLYPIRWMFDLIFGSFSSVSCFKIVWLNWILALIGCFGHSFHIEIT